MCIYYEINVDWTEAWAHTNNQLRRLSWWSTRCQYARNLHNFSLFRGKHHIAPSPIDNHQKLTVLPSSVVSIDFQSAENFSKIVTGLVTLYSLICFDKIFYNVSWICGILGHIYCGIACVLKMSAYLYVCVGCHLVIYRDENDLNNWRAAIWGGK